MCGIYGFIGRVKDPKKILEIYESLAVETEIRGTHATGYYGLSDAAIMTEKAPLKASLFLQTPEYKKLYQDPPSVLIGHNRYATHGKPEINENNHPFTTGRFGFIHNGIVGNVKPDMEITQKTECDSEMIFRYFLKKFYNDHNHYRSLEKTMKCFDTAGDFACALVDSKDRDLYLFRNSARPIVYIQLKELNVIFFASTSEILKSALIMNNVNFKDTKIRSLKTGQIMKITEDLEIKNFYVENLKQPAPVVKYVYVPKINYAAKNCKVTTYTKPAKLTGWECKECGRVFIKPEFAKQHIIDVHKIADLEEIGKKIQHTISKERVAFGTNNETRLIKCEKGFRISHTWAAA